MQKDFKLSVIVPIYNVEPYLRKCLDSIVNQSYRNLEIILVDDGSLDHCGEICDEYAKKDDRIIVIHKQNGGVSTARNEGLEKATGDWVTFVDPDDWCDVDYYKCLFDAMREQNIDVFCSGGYFKEFNNTSIKCHTFTDNVLFEGRKQTDFLMAKTLVEKCGDPKNKYALTLGSTCDKLYKLSFLRENQLKFDTTLDIQEDMLFNFIVFDKARRVEVCDHIGYHYCQNILSSLTHIFDPTAPSVCVAFIDRLNDYMGNREPSRLIQDAISSRSIIAFSRSLKSCYFHKDNHDPYKATVAEIRELKRKPEFHAAIHSRFSKFLTKKQFALKCLLRLPWVWPLKLAYGVKQSCLKDN